jgi:hypothetical protein
MGPILRIFAPGKFITPEKESTDDRKVEAIRNLYFGI